MIINPELTNKIFKSMPIPYLVLATDSPKFTILEVSNLYLEVTGTDASEVLGKGILEIYPYASHEGQPEGSSKLLQSLDNLLQTQKTQVITFLVYDTISRVSKKSVKRFLSTEHTPIFDSSGEINCILHTVKPSEENEELNQFRSLFWENPDPVFALNLNGKILRANAAFEQLAEYNGQNWNDQTFISFVPPKEQKKIQSQLAKTLKGEVLTFDSDFITNSGNRKTITITIIPIQVNGEIVGINAMAKDITETKHLLALESLEKSVLEMSSKKNATLIEIFDYYIEGIEKLHDGMLCSIMEVRDNRLYHMASRSLPSEFLQKIEGEAIGEYAGSCGTAAYMKKKVVVQDISTDICWANYSEIAESNNLHACWSFPLMNSSQDVMATFAVYYHTTKNPTSVEMKTVERAGKILQIILESKQNENALQISNQRYEYLTQTTTEAIWDWDLESNAIYRGIGFQKIFGHKFNQRKIDPSYWKTHVHPSDYQRLKKKMDEAIQNNKKSWEFKYRYLLGDGTYSYVHDRGYVVREPSGKAIRMVGALRDISLEKIHEREKNLKLFISNVFAQEKTLELALQESLKGILAYTELAYAEAWVVNIDKTNIELTAFTGKKTMMDAKEIHSFHKKIGLPGKAWESKESVFVADVQTSKYFVRKEFAARHNLVSAVAIPIKIQDEVIGVITMFSQQSLTSSSISNILGNSVPNRLASEVYRKKTESELNFFFDLSPDLLCIAGFDGFFKKINFAFETLLGYRKGEILKTSYINLTHPEDRDSTQTNLLELKAGNPIPYLENRFKTKSGKYVWLAWSLTPLLGDKLVFATAKDISEKKKLEDLLDKANKMTKIGSWEAKLINGAVYWSEITREIYEVDSDFQPNLESFFEFYLEGNSRQIIQQRAEESMRTGMAWDEELQIKTYLGNLKWVRTTGQTEIIDGVAKRTYGSVQDITKNKEAEIKLRELNEDLRKQADELADSNAELEQFAYVASHDLQEPLRMITGFLNLLKTKYGQQLDERAHKYIHFATNGATQMRQIILDLLAFSLIGKNEPEQENINLNEIMQEITFMLKTKKENSKASIKWQNLPTIIAEKSPIRQLFLNLISNGIKYQKADQIPQIEITSEDCHTHWKFGVKDNGIGIAPEYLEKIFVIFQRLHGSTEYSGTGMGLAICKKTVGYLGGIGIGKRE